MQASNYLEAVGEFVTKNILEELLTDEEGHIGFLETQRDLV
jgi:bacterioferritin